MPEDNKTKEQKPVEQKQVVDQAAPPQDQAQSQLTSDDVAYIVQKMADTDLLPRWMRANGNGRIVQIKAVDDSTVVTTGDGKVIFMITPQFNNLVIVRVYAYVTTVSSSGALTVQIRNVTQSVDVLSTAITIDQSENTSLTAATPAVINKTNATVSEGDLIAIDVDGAGTSAQGLGVAIVFA